MKIGIIILSRFNSSRLPGKALMNINGKPLLEHIVYRISLITLPVDYCIATSESDLDKPIVDFCKQKGFNYFRGSLNNVAERFLNCAINKNWDYAVRINGDNLFVDIDTLEEMIRRTLKFKYNFFTNVPGRTFPYGMSIEIIKVNYFKEIYKQISSKYHLEHVTSYIYENYMVTKKNIFVNNCYTNLKDFKLAIDNYKDVLNVNKIFILLPNLEYIGIKEISLLIDKKLLKFD